MAARKRSAATPAPVIEDTTTLVRLLPVPGAYITGEPAVEREVTPEEAERLLSYRPAAYRRAPRVVVFEPEEEVIPLERVTFIPQPPDIEDAPGDPEPQE